MKENRQRLMKYRLYTRRIEELEELREIAEAAAEKVTPSGGGNGAKTNASKVERGVVTMADAGAEIDALEALKRKEAEKVKTAAGLLKPAYRVVIIDYYINLYSIQDIADRYGLKRDAIRKRLNRAAAKIKL